MNGIGLRPLLVQNLDIANLPGNLPLQICLNSGFPIAGRVTQSTIRGVSQSGNFTRQFICMGIDQGEANRMVHNGAWPQIAGWRVVANVRWGGHWPRSHRRRRLCRQSPLSAAPNLSW